MGSHSKFDQLYAPEHLKMMLHKRQKRLLDLVHAATDGLAATERMLITVKTYRTLSAKHGELVCTAELRWDAAWI